MSSILYITDQAWNKLEQAVKKMPGHETGGILMGYSLNQHEQLVTFASGPGPRAVHQPHSVLLDDSYLTKLARKKNVSGRLKYLGDWHSHTVRRLSPSKVDKVTVFKKASQAIYTSPAPLMLIAGLSKHHQVHARGYMVDNSSNSLREVRKIMVVEKSKLRQLAQMLS